MSYQFHHRVTVRNCVFIYSLKSSKYWPTLDRRGQMNGTAIPWRIFFYRIPLTRRMKNSILQGWMISQYRILKSKLPKYRLKKSSISQYRKPPSPPPWCFSILWHYLVFFLCLGSKLGFLPKELMNKQASMTGGLVGQSEHLFLPSVPPLVTMILTLLSLMVRNLLLTSKIIILQDYGVRGRGHSKFRTGRLPPKSPNL